MPIKQVILIDPAQDPRVIRDNEDRDLIPNSFEARGVEESANRYDNRGELLHGPISNSRQVITETEIVFRFTKGFPTAADMEQLRSAGFIDTGAARNQGREFTGPRKSYQVAAEAS